MNKLIMYVEGWCYRVDNISYYIALRLEYMSASGTYPA